MKFCCLLLLLLQLSKLSAQQPVMYVNGIPVDEREFRREMRRLRSEIIAEFSLYQVIKNNDSFWTTSVSGPTPLQLLRERTKQALISIKIQEQLLFHNGLWKVSTYDSFLLQLVRVNKSRQEAAAGGGVIYGPVEHSETSYFDYLFTNAVIQLKSLWHLKSMDAAALSFGICLEDHSTGIIQSRIPVIDPSKMMTEGAYKACLASCVESATTVVDSSLYFRQFPY